MAEDFYPQNRLPKKGSPVLNGNGEQLNISDPRYRYQDGLENTEVPGFSSTNELFFTAEAATARAEQLGCNGYHLQVASNGDTYYAPCGDGILDITGQEWLALRIEQIASALNFTYIGNYRILTWDQPFTGVSSFNGWIIDAIYTNTGQIILDSQDIAIDFRYSVDGQTWSLWSNVGTAFTGESENYSSNNKSWLFKIALDPTKPFYPEFRFTSVIRNDDGTLAYTSDSPIDPKVAIVGFELDLSYDTTATEVIIKKPVPNCSSEKSNRPVAFKDCGPLTFNPYSVNKALNLYQELSKTVANMFGWDVNYYSVQPQGRSKDVILKEYTLFDVVDEKCIKINVPNNQFPDNKINYDPFGLQFEDTFEVHIDKGYFETYFGRGSQPRKRDIIYFPLTNRIYEINSTYLFRDFMNAPVYFKVELKKYSPKSNTYFKDPAYKEELDGIALTQAELFGEDIRSEEAKITKPQQFEDSTQRRQSDPVRDYIYEGLPVIGYDLNNNWTIVFNNYYDMNDAFVANSDFPYEPDAYRNAVRYKTRPFLGETDEISYTCWFNIKNYFNNETLAKKAYPSINITVESYDASEIIYSTHPYKHGLTEFGSYSNDPEGYVSIMADDNHKGGFRVKRVLDDYRFSVINPAGNAISPIRNGWRMQKAQSRNLIDGLYLDGSTGSDKGIRIDLIHSGVNEPSLTNFINRGSIEVVINDNIINSDLQFEPQDGEFYALVVNVSNKYKQMAVNIWQMSYDPTNPQQQSSDLVKVHEDVRSFTQTYTFDAPKNKVTDLQSPFYGTDNNAYKIWTSPILLSNVRLFKQMIDIDKQSIVLNQNVVRDAQLAYIIDNASPQLKMRKFRTPK